MKSIITTIIACVLPITIFYTTYYFINECDKHQVKQVVVVNEFDFFVHVSSRPTPPLNMIVRKNDGSIDSVALKYWDVYNKKEAEHHRRLFAPYKLTTTYNNHEVVDYGDAKYIDSIKCIRFNFMLRERVNYDKKDSIAIVVKAMEEKAIEDKKNELERLNEKLCE